MNHFQSLPNEKLYSRTFAIIIHIISAVNIESKKILSELNFMVNIKPFIIYTFLCKSFIFIILLLELNRSFFRTLFSHIPM